ncbi:DUF4381 domain-containing protein [Bremerella sp. T1]|uniref:DUF4381 domain-containing protein n=1 Tax=Bremerella sp. TYQ1 TaxID=3119568 RepID=UPI001CC93DD4|nr:DUF4381 domain-containing protein [Bremerella volcania]UBM33820.1 DUF4381 domain-containing protein [Bremerella volcania]
MSDDPGSLDNLHDIVMPPDVAWFPLAPGWYVLIVIVLVAIGWAMFRVYQKWQANAYRRAALQELQHADSIFAISEILRRTALVFTPRETMVDLIGNDWADWLTQRTSQPMPTVVRQAFAEAMYQPNSAGTNIEPVRAYATAWIQQHQTAERAPSG